MPATATSPSRPRTQARLCDAPALVERWQTSRDEAARTELMARYLPLARRLARRYHHPYEPTEDLQQVAALGLIGAIARFDVTRGGHFEGYVIPTILGELKRHFRDTGWSAHVPRRAQELALQVDRCARSIAAERGRPASVHDIAAALGISTEDVLVGLDAAVAHYASSLDAPVGAELDEPVSLGDCMGGFDDGFELVDAKLSLNEALKRLPFEERTALHLQMDQDLKQREIAERMGCSQMQVSRLLRRAAERIRQITDPTLDSASSLADAAHAG